MTFSSKQTKSYRDKLVAQIQRAGQELIERAETMVSPGCCLITDFKIEISFPQNSISQIRFTTSVINHSDFLAMAEKQGEESHD